MLSLRFANNTTIIKQNEHLCFNVHFETYDDVEDLCFRVVLSTKGQNRIGMAEINKFISVKANCQYYWDFDIDISYLSEGDYSFFVVMYEIDEMGNNNILDGPPINFLFTFNNYKRGGLKWDNKCWGNIRFPEISCNEVKADYV